MTTNTRDARRCISHFKERLVGEIKQYCIRELNRPNILDPEEIVNKFVDEQVTLRESRNNQYKMSMQSDSKIVVISVSKVIKVAAGGGVAGAAAGAFGVGGTGAGIGALIGIIGGPIGVAIGVAIGAGVGAAVGGATGAVSGGGIGGAAAKRFGKDIVIPLRPLLCRIGNVEPPQDSMTVSKMTVTVEIPPNYRPRQRSTSN